jgi:ABC-2 type transport system ATP-binding protein
MRIESLLDMVGLRAVSNRAVGTFSKGMARRIGLAQALINDPDLLILDEPTTGLDPIGTRQIKDLILELAKRGKTILLCSHLLADVEDVCDRIAILYGGRIQSEGRVKELLVQTGRTQIMTGRISEGAIDEIKRIVEGEQEECVVSSPMERLESFFIRAVSTAQAESRPTSGVVASSQISDFLSSPATPKSILDKLVSTEREPVPVAEEAQKTEQLKAPDAAEEHKDEQLLQKLTEPIKPERMPEPVSQTEPVEPRTTEQEETEKSILEQLTKGSGHVDRNEAGDTSEGEPDDA